MRSIHYAATEPSRHRVPSRGIFVVMKLKRVPEDFRVEELPVVSGGDRGRFVFYRLWKRSLGTLEAVEAIRRRWNLAAAQIHYGGMKDRHAETIQYLTILDGPERVLRETNLELEPLGRLQNSYGPRDFRGNRFAVVLRDLTREAAENVRIACADLARDGLPNYFDDQRFGSVGFEGGFIAEAWLKGNHEEALRLAIAAPNLSDRPDIQEEKAILVKHWGNWAEAKAALPRSHSRSLVTYLADHPVDFRGAFARVRRDLRSIYFSAYQSYLWNQILAQTIRKETQPNQRTEYEFKIAKMPIHHGLDPEQSERLRALRIPLPTSRNVLPAEGSMQEIARDVLAPIGLAWEDLRVKHLKDVFFSKGDRAAIFQPDGLRSEIRKDELYPGRSLVSLAFDLPKGAYATLLVKRCTHVATGETSNPDADISE